MSVMDKMKEFQASVAVFAGLVVSWGIFTTWWDGQVVSKKEYQMGINELRIGQVESDLRDFRRTGIDTLNAEDREEYEDLVEEKKTLICNRNNMLGITDNAPC